MASFALTCASATPTSGVITGQIFVDSNGNGTIDPGEPPLSGVIVILIDTSTQGQVMTLTTVSNAQGIYRFVNVPPNEYIISFAMPPGYVPVSAAELSVNVSTSGNVDLPAVGVGVQSERVFLPLVVQPE